MQTHRDQEIVGWLGRVGAASAEQVRARFGMCQSRAYARLRVLVAGGLLDHKQLLYREAGLYVVTRRACAGRAWSNCRSSASASPASHMSEKSLASRSRSGQRPPRGTSSLSESFGCSSARRAASSPRSRWE